MKMSLGWLAISACSKNRGLGAFVWKRMKDKMHHGGKFESSPIKRDVKSDS